MADSILSVPLSKKQLFAQIEANHTIDAVSLSMLVLTDKQLKDNMYPLPPTATTSNGAGASAGAGAGAGAGATGAAAAAQVPSGAGWVSGNTPTNSTAAPAECTLQPQPLVAQGEGSSTPAAAAAAAAAAKEGLDGAPLYALDCEMVQTKGGLELARYGALPSLAATPLSNPGCAGTVLCSSLSSSQHPLATRGGADTVRCAFSDMRFTLEDVIESHAC
jgi:hypothetical protein